MRRSWINAPLLATLALAACKGERAPPDSRITSALITLAFTLDAATVTPVDTLPPADATFEAAVRVAGLTGRDTAFDTGSRHPATVRFDDAGQPDAIDPPRLSLTDAAVAHANDGGVTLCAEVDHSPAAFERSLDQLFLDLQLGVD